MTKKGGTDTGRGAAAGQLASLPSSRADTVHMQSWAFSGNGTIPSATARCGSACHNLLLLHAEPEHHYEDEFAGEDDDDDLPDGQGLTQTPRSRGTPQVSARDTAAAGLETEVDVINLHGVFASDIKHANASRSTQLGVLDSLQDASILTSLRAQHPHLGEHGFSLNTA